MAAVVGVVLAYGLSVQRAVRDRGWPAAIPSWVLVMVWPMDVGAIVDDQWERTDDPIVLELTDRLDRNRDKFVPKSVEMFSGSGPDARYGGRMAPGMSDWLADYWLQRLATRLNELEPIMRPRLSSDAPQMVAHVYELADAMPRMIEVVRRSNREDSGADIPRWLVTRRNSVELAELEPVFDWRRYSRAKSPTYYRGILRVIPQFPFAEVLVQVGEKVLVFSTRAGHARFAGMLVGIENPEEPDADDEITDTNSAEPGAREGD